MQLQVAYSSLPLGVVSKVDSFVLVLISEASKKDPVNDPQVEMSRSWCVWLLSLPVMFEAIWGGSLVHVFDVEMPEDVVTNSVPNVAVPLSRKIINVLNT